MRILESHVDPISGHTYAVIVNPIAGGLADGSARRYRLICALDPDWESRANSLRSISRTPRIHIYETVDVLDVYGDLPGNLQRVAALRRESRVLGGVAYQQQLWSRQ